MERFKTHTGSRSHTTPITSPCMICEQLKIFFCWWLDDTMGCPWFPGLSFRSATRNLLSLCGVVSTNRWSLILLYIPVLHYCHELGCFLLSSVFVFVCFSIYLSICLYAIIMHTWTSHTSQNKIFAIQHLYYRVRADVNSSCQLGIVKYRPEMVC